LLGHIYIQMQSQPQFMLCNVERDTQLSERAAERNRPIGFTGTTFDPRPTPTQYTDFQVINPPDQLSSGVSHPIYDVGKVFRGGDRMGPWSGFAANVNTESSLRNQFFALQKCEQSNYLPSTESDMYTVGAPPVPPLDEREPKQPKVKCLPKLNASTRVDRLNSNCKGCFEAPTV